MASCADGTRITTWRNKKRGHVCTPGWWCRDAGAQPSALEICLMKASTGWEGSVSSDASSRLRGTQTPWGVLSRCRL